MKLKDLPVSMGSKLVGSQVREWGRTVHSSSHANLMRKYKVYDKWQQWCKIIVFLIEVISTYHFYLQYNDDECDLTKIIIRYYWISNENFDSFHGGDNSDLLYK